MEYEMLKQAAAAITMPEDMKRRIINNCTLQLSNTKENQTMTNRKKSMFPRKPAAILAALAILLSLSVTAVAAPDVMKGFFRDITNWQGAVVGTSYEQATDEIAVSVTVNGNMLTVHAAIADPQMIPYVYAERLGIGEYKIKAENGRTVKKGSAESVEIINGTAAIAIPLEDLECFSYNLIISAFVAEAKAEQPLPLNGRWECTFVK